ncbi:MAG: GcrA cell cycle regulator [Betaproteobacteria bacterium]|nr:GcrA cell cycle regulator [Betaproteobacteria bacterium]
MAAPTLWTEAQDATLRQLWGSGLSASKIGAQIGMTKNAVIGRAHRMGLATRGNPITKAPAGTPRAPRPSRAHLPRTIIEAPKVAPIEKPQAGVLPAPSPRVSPSGPSAASGNPSKPAPSLWRRCQWPLARKSDRHILFLCEAAPLPGRPYCGPHCAIAYAPRGTKVA